MRWSEDDRKLKFREDWKEEDENRNEPGDIRTMREIRKLSNDIMPFIQMEEDVAENYQDKKLPILDLKVWKVETEIGGRKKMQVGLNWFSLVWFLMLQCVTEVLLCIHTKFKLNRMRNTRELSI